MEVDAGPGEFKQGLGYPVDVVGEDIGELEAGQTYRFRLVG